MAGDALTAVRIPSAIPALGPRMQASLAAPRALKTVLVLRRPNAQRAAEAFLRHHAPPMPRHLISLLSPRPPPLF